MKAESAIKVTHLSKKYSIGIKKDGTLKESISGLFHLSKLKSDEFWALKDISFEINKGDVVGVIGKNGAGKSTLLKILSQITKPTEGRIEINGRVASLLEVGTGFHPELSGRENIYLNGTILGMTRKEVKEKFDEIVTFSGVEKFIDTPVKHYSSGMYVRLAFAVAAHLEPEILIIDEVLAVGDAEFQKKCLGKMKEVSGEGRTVIFVSHNINAIQSLCKTGIFISDGKIIINDHIDKVVNKYLNTFSNQLNYIKLNELNKSILSNDLVEITSCFLKNNGVTDTEIFNINKETELTINYRPKVDGLKLNISISIYSENEDYILASPSNTDENYFLKEHLQKEYSAICKIPPFLLNENNYLFSILIVKDGNEVILHADKILKVEFFDDGEFRNNFFGKWSGLIRPILEWNVIETA